ncbi:MAG: M23 family metallopeptidase [Candidatus Microsaccharimonas sp.]
MALGKNLGIAAAVIAVGAFLATPLTVGTAIAIFASGNSCTAAGAASVVDVNSLTGQSAESWMASFDDQEKAQKLALVSTIIQAGSERATPATQFEILVVIGTGIQETNLTNLPDGDEESAGFLQQQPRYGWGTYAQVTDPYTATNTFLDHLEKVPNYASMTMKQAAIAVQNPAIWAYQRWNWDKTAAELYSMAIAPGAATTCQSTGWIAPLAGIAVNSDSYGMRFHPIKHEWLFHYGTDIGAGRGTPIRAVHSGTVAFVGPNGGYGNFVLIDHGNGVTTGYAHIMPDGFAPGLQVGTKVNTGDVIAYVGTTGTSNGYHLHFEVKVDGENVDPVDFMKTVGVDLMVANP